ncbi:MULTISPECIES: hypothetical protein [unclassified Ectothiorhodospira]|uniref:hypothetical protein n=1 Tax=unclassified Ectothiorhodospira TaxID=2684909 RepID=UPI001EE7BA6F|nr:MULTISPECIES: hypothetical protein [unclassified Ectothiorhodospira]MCG5517243.1 hypothetical protein [Ectothiorhodospira sp. 9100]MCG5520138.1 hypothetical protein [Ectothiorhodospira sp. 9905]
MPPDDLSAFASAPEGSVVVESVTTAGKPCRIVDTTGTVRRDVLASLLEQLIAERRFGLSALSAAGSGVINLDEPQFAHVQLDEALYRLILLPDEARLELF